MSLSVPHAVIFDFGETLLHLTEWDIPRGNRRMLALCNDNPHHRTLEEVMAVAKGFDEIVRPLRDVSGLEFSVQHFHNLLYDTLGMTFEQSMDELELEFWTAASRHVVMPGIVDALAFLKARGVRLGVFSNNGFGPGPIAHELKQHGLLPYFDCVLSSARYGIRKPHAVVFEVACRRMKVQPRDAWYVGDTFSADVIGATAAGLFPIWLNSRNEKVSDLPEIPRHLEVHSWTEFVSAVQPTFTDACGEHDGY